MLNLTSFLAQATDPIGRILPPNTTPGVDPQTGQLTGIVIFLNSILKLIFIAAGLWAFFNFIIAGFGFMTAGGDAKKVSSSWDRIWQSLIGLIIIVSSFLVAAIVGMLLFGNPGAILTPTLGPTP